MRLAVLIIDTDTGFLTGVHIECNVCIQTDYVSVEKKHSRPLSVWLEAFSIMYNESSTFVTHTHTHTNIFFSYVYTNLFVGF